VVVETDTYAEYSFLAHLQQLTTDQLNDVARHGLRNGLNIRRPRKKSNMLNDKRIKSCIEIYTATYLLKIANFSYPVSFGATAVDVPFGSLR